MNELPPLPAGWEWETDMDGDWVAVGDGLRVYVASAAGGVCECVSMVPQQRELVRGHAFIGVPVRVAVAVAMANGMPWEPATAPLRDNHHWPTQKQEGS